MLTPRLDLFPANSAVISRPIVANRRGVRIHDNVAAAYIIENLETGKYYFGSSMDVSGRLNKHLHSLKTNQHKNPGLQKEFNECNDKTSIVIHLMEVPTILEAQQIEQSWLNVYHGTPNCLNRSNNALVPNSGYARNASANIKLAAFNQSPEGIILLNLKRIKLKQQWADPARRASMLAAMDSLKKEVVIDGVAYRGLRHAANTLGVTKPTIVKRMRIANSNVISLQDLKPKFRAVKINGVVYDTILSAAQKLNTHPSTMRVRINSTDPKWETFKYFEKEE